jgi:hypothetical protein
MFGWLEIGLGEFGVLIGVEPNKEGVVELGLRELESKQTNC